MDRIYSDAPPKLRDLSRPEHLLVWALRVIVLGHGDCPVLHRTFETACGEFGEHALVTYHTIVKIIAMAGRRRLEVHVPGCACVSPDEQEIVGVIKAAQDSLAGDEMVLRGKLERLLGCTPPQSLVMATQAVARILQDRGRALPGAELKVVTQLAPGPRPTLH